MARQPLRRKDLIIKSIYPSPKNKNAEAKTVATTVGFRVDVPVQHTAIDGIIIPSTATIHAISLLRRAVISLFCKHIQYKRYTHPVLHCL